MEVSGNLSHGAAGIYSPRGIYDGQVTYQKGYEAHWLWHHKVIPWWEISDNVGSDSAWYWRTDNGDLENVYTPRALATGIATVAEY